MVKIALDFDGTVVEHRYPEIGKTNGNCVEILKDWVTNKGVKLILDTMRSGKELDDAVEWFKNNGIELYSIGKDKNQESWTSSNKCYANYSIDDRNIGCPLIMDSEGIRPMVDWNKIRNYVF